MVFARQNQCSRGGARHGAPIINFSQELTRELFELTGIVLTNQFRSKVDELTNHRNLTFRDLLSQSRHASAQTRKDAMIGLRDLCERHPQQILVSKPVETSPLKSLLDAVAPRLVDLDSGVRHALYGLLCYIFKEAPRSNFHPVLRLFTAFLSNATTHMDVGVRYHSLVFLKLILGNGHASTSLLWHDYHHEILPNLMRILSESSSLAWKDIQKSLRRCQLKPEHQTAVGLECLHLLLRLHPSIAKTDETVPEEQEAARSNPKESQGKSAALFPDEGAPSIQNVVQPSAHLPLSDLQLPSPPSVAEASSSNATSSPRKRKRDDSVPPASEHGKSAGALTKEQRRAKAKEACKAEKKRKKNQFDILSHLHLDDGVDNPLASASDLGFGADFVALPSAKSESESIIEKMRSTQKYKPEFRNCRQTKRRKPNNAQPLYSEENFRNSFIDLKSINVIGVKSSESAEEEENVELKPKDSNLRRSRFNLAAFLLKCSNLCRDAWLEVDLDSKGVTRKNARMVQLAVDLFRTSAEILVKLAKEMRSKVESFLESSGKDDAAEDSAELKRRHVEAQKNLRELEQAYAVSLKLKASFLKHFFSAFPLSTRSDRIGEQSATVHVNTAMCDIVTLLCREDRPLPVVPALATNAEHASDSKDEESESGASDKDAAMKDAEDAEEAEEGFIQLGDDYDDNEDADGEERKEDAVMEHGDRSVEQTELGEDAAPQKRVSRSERARHDRENERSSQALGKVLKFVRKTFEAIEDSREYDRLVPQLLTSLASLLSTTEIILPEENELVAPEDEAATLSAFGQMFGRVGSTSYLKLECVRLLCALVEGDTAARYLEVDSVRQWILDDAPALLVADLSQKKQSQIVEAVLQLLLACGEIHSKLGDDSPLDFNAVQAPLARFLSTTQKSDSSSRHTFAKVSLNVQCIFIAVLPHFTAFPASHRLLACLSEVCRSDGESPSGLIRCKIIDVLHENRDKIPKEEYLSFLLTSLLPPIPTSSSASASALPSAEKPRTFLVADRVCANLRELELGRNLLASCSPMLISHLNKLIQSEKTSASTSTNADTRALFLHSFRVAFRALQCCLDELTRAIAPSQDGGNSNASDAVSTHLASDHRTASFAFAFGRLLWKFFASVPFAEFGADRDMFVVIATRWPALVEKLLGTVLEEVEGGQTSMSHLLDLLSLQELHNVLSSDGKEALSAVFNAIETAKNPIGSVSQLTQLRSCRRVILGDH